MPERIGIALSIVLFGVPALLLWGATGWLVPALVQRGWEPLAAWFLAGGLLVFGPLLAAALLVAWSEVPGRSLAGALELLRIRRLSRSDWRLAIGTLVVTIAATAGLHFTPALLDAIRARGVDVVTITLHVGYGTFKPVRVDQIEDHIVDPERYEVPDAAAATINRAKAEGRRVVVVGTTSTRALESAVDDEGRVRAGAGNATMCIRPGHTFRVVDALMTNFHVPRSSLLFLVCAFAGRERVLATYAHAVANGYRFYSYGDAMLIVTGSNDE